MWELIFLMVILKIPIVYLCWVVWWAVKSKPVPEEPALQRVSITPRPWDDPRRRRRPRPPRPHGGPTRGYARSARAAAHAASR